jgi:hypothetical protein
MLRLQVAGVLFKVAKLYKLTQKKVIDKTFSSLIANFAKLKSNNIIM